MQKKIFLIVGLFAGGVAIFLLSTFVFLASSGKLTNETLTRIPIVGMFFGEPTPIIVKIPEEKKEALEEEPEKAYEELTPMAHFEFKAPFSQTQLADLNESLVQSREAYQSKMEDVVKREEAVARKEKDLERRFEELNSMTQQLAEVPKSTEDSTYETLATVYESLDKTDQAAKMLVKLGQEAAAQILFRLDPEKAGAIIADLDDIDGDFSTNVQMKITRLKTE